MAKEITPHLFHLITDAALKSFWHRKPFGAFLRQCGISQSVLSSWTQEETKREFLDRIMPIVEKHQLGAQVITKMARSLAEQSSFPDLARCEDYELRKAQALQSVLALRQYLQKASTQEQSEREAIERRAISRANQERQVKFLINLEQLSTRLKDLSKTSEAPKPGMTFKTGSMIFSTISKSVVGGHTILMGGRSMARPQLKALLI